VYRIITSDVYRTEAEYTAVEVSIAKSPEPKKEAREKENKEKEKFPPLAHCHFPSSPIYLMWTYLGL
jgi:hypothetical protein